MRLVRRRYEFDAFVEVDIDDELTLLDNGKCVSVIRGTKVVGYMNRTAELSEILHWPHTFKIVAYRGTMYGFDQTRPIAVLKYRERGG